MNITGMDTLDDGTYEDEYGTAIPAEPSILHVDGDPYDLNNAEVIDELQIKLHDLRDRLRGEDLPEYDGRSTNWGGGGRARLLYDQARVDLAERYDGDDGMSFEDQHREAMDVVRIVAIKNRARF